MTISRPDGVEQTTCASGCGGGPLSRRRLMDRSSPSSLSLNGAGERCDIEHGSMLHLMARLRARETKKNEKQNTQKKHTRQQQCQMLQVILESDQDTSLSKGHDHDADQEPQRFLKTTRPQECGVNDNEQQQEDEEQQGDEEQKEAEEQHPDEAQHEVDEKQHGEVEEVPGRECKTRPARRGAAR